MCQPEIDFVGDTISDICQTGHESLASSCWAALVAWIMREDVRFLSISSDISPKCRWLDFDWSGRSLFLAGTSWRGPRGNRNGAATIQSSEAISILADF
jgi:hypothetical protein